MHEFSRLDVGLVWEMREDRLKGLDRDEDDYINRTGLDQGTGEIPGANECSDRTGLDQSFEEIPGGAGRDWSVTLRGMRAALRT